MRGKPAGSVMVKRWVALADHTLPQEGDLVESVPGGSWYEVLECLTKYQRFNDETGVYEDLDWLPAGRSFRVRVVKLEPQDQDPDWVLS
jgi:hypothetical protein